MAEHPPESKVSAADWEQTPPAVKASFRRLTRQRRWFQIVTLMLLGLLVGAGWIAAQFARPYMRVIRQNLEPVCTYRGPFDYVLQDGDTLFGLSLRYSVPVMVIASANGIANVHVVSAGATVRIPESFCVAPANLTRAADIEAAGTEFTSDAIATRMWYATNPPTPSVLDADCAQTLEAQWQATQAQFTPLPPGEAPFATATAIIAFATHRAACRSAGESGRATPPSNFRFADADCAQTLEAQWQATQAQFTPLPTGEAPFATATAIIAFATHRAACRTAGESGRATPPSNFRFADEDCVQTVEAQWQATQAQFTPVPPGEAPFATATAIILRATQRAPCAVTIEEYATRAVMTPNPSP